MNFIDKTFASFKSFAKVLVNSRPVHIRRDDCAQRIVVMGNGPSLNETLARNAALIRSLPSMAVNFAANAPVFSDLKPKYYVLADPFFFSGQGADNLTSLWSNLAKVDWNMTLFVPVVHVGKVHKLLENRNITAQGFNAVGAEGFITLTHRLFSRNLAMPRPRNVLIPALMLSIALGFREVDIVGADHTWMKTLSVTDDNEVVSIQEHFYSDSDSERSRVCHEYQGYRLYQIVESFAVAFKSYVDIANYADTIGVGIYNCTPGSFIDAFPRRELI